MSNADQLKDQGIELYKMHQYEQAVKVFEQAKRAYTEESREEMAGEMLANIGLVHRSLGEGQQALDAMAEALTIFQRLEDALRMAQVLANIGGVYAKMNDNEQAYNNYRQAADIFEEVGEREMYGQTLLAMGRLQLDEGKFMAGAATYSVALENIDNPTWQQKIIKNLGGTVNKVLGVPSPDKKSDAGDNKDDTKTT
jgi:tetratricopeptide (TPR) repeat protein